MRKVDIKTLISIFTIFSIMVSFLLCSNLDFNTKYSGNYHHHDKNQNNAQSHINHFQSLISAVFINHVSLLVIVFIVFLFTFFRDIFLLNLFFFKYIKNFSPPEKIHKIYLTLNKSRAPPICFNF